MILIMKTRSNASCIFYSYSIEPHVLLIYRIYTKTPEPLPSFCLEGNAGWSVKFDNDSDPHGIRFYDTHYGA